MNPGPTLTAVVAMTPSRVIGREGGLPWHLPADLAFFKRTTKGHAVVMGRRTWDSIGRPLPNRRNIVLTRDPEWRADGAEVIHSPVELALLPGIATARVFIIGGAEIYAAFLDSLDELIVSHVREDHPGDTWFPPFEDRFPVVTTLEEYPDFVVKRWSRERGD